MKHPFSEYLFQGVFEAVVDGPTRDRDGEKLWWSEMPATDMVVLKQRLTKIFELIYDDGFDAGADQTAGRE